MKSQYILTPEELLQLEEYLYWEAFDADENSYIKASFYNQGIYDAIKYLLKKMEGEEDSNEF